MAARDAGGLGDFERLILQQAATVVALELMRQRAMRDTERRLAGDVLAEALDRAARASASWRRACGRSAWASSAAVLVFARRRPGGRRGRARPPAARRGRRRARGRRASGCCARSSTPRRARSAWSSPRAREPRWPRATATCGRPPAAPAPVGALRRTFHEARCALEAAALAERRRARRSPPTATSAPSSSCSRSRTTRRCGSTATACSARSRTASGEYGDELIRSLEAFIEQNGQWEKAARELFCHRHTLRYRIRRVEELTGRDLEQRARPDRVLAGAAGAGAGRDVRVAVLGPAASSRRRSCATWRSPTRSPDLLLLDLDEAARARPSPTRTAAARRARRGRRRARRSARRSTACDVLVNSASYRVNLDAMRACLEARLPLRRPRRPLLADRRASSSCRPRFEAAGLLALLGHGLLPRARRT